MALNMGVIGMGTEAAVVVRELARHPGIRLTACADVRAEAREDFLREFGGQVFADGLDLCASPAADAVYIAAPQELHARLILAALHSGKHVLVEKPMALNLDDCAAINATVAGSGLKLLVGRGSHGFDAPILKMRQLIESGAVGAPAMVHSWCFTDFIYRPRRPDEFDSAKGGGAVLNQGWHLVDVQRVLAGGVATRVQARSWVLDRERPMEGTFTAWVEFSGPVAGTIVYSGYDGFDSAEFSDWIGTYGRRKPSDRHGASRRRSAGLSRGEEASLKAAAGYGGGLRRAAGGEESPAPYAPRFGVTVVTCERADLRQSPGGVWVYGAEGLRDVPAPVGRGIRGNVVDEFYEAVVHDRPVIRDGSWGEATLEVLLAIRRSAAEGHEVVLSRQRPLPPGAVDAYLERMERIERQNG